MGATDNQAGTQGGRRRGIPPAQAAVPPDLDRLNVLLRAERDVSEIAVRQTDRDELIRRACKALTAAKAYHAAWIALFDESARPVAHAQSRVGKTFAAMLFRLRQGRLPACVRRAVLEHEFTVAEDPPATCGDCPLAARYAGRCALAAPLSDSSGRRGVLAAITPKDVAVDKHERRVLRAVACDIGAGLRAIAQASALAEANQALARSQAELESLLRAVPAGIALVADRVMRQVNQRFCDMTGYSREELIGRTSRVLFLTDEDYQRIGEEGYAKLHAEGTGTVEARLRRKDGRVIDVLIRGALLDPSDPAAGATFAIMDITERVKAEAELRLRDRAIDASTQGISITDPARPDDPIVYVNQGFERMTGYAREEVLGRNLRFLEGEETSPAAAGALRQAVRRQQEATVEILNYRKDATGFWNRVSVTPVRDASGRLRNFVATHSDVTERRALQEQLVQSQKMEAIGQLAGGIAHDFRNQLTVVKGYGEMLLRRGLVAPEGEGKVREILDATARATDLTAQLLAFGRKELLRPEVADIGELVARATAALPRLIEEDVRIRTVSRAAGCLVSIDVARFHQAVMNLVLNARDAMPEGGELTIESDCVELDAAFAEAHPDVKPGPHARVTVRDTGAGMAPETLGRLFEPFFTTKPGGKGTGLGLAMVYGFVTQSRGTVTVESEPGKGTTFRLYFPRVHEEAAGPSAEAAAPAARGGGETILLAEDEAPARAVLGDALREIGYSVLEAESAAAALDIARGHAGDIHLLITDVVMSGMNGVELAERLRQDRPRVPVLYVSGYAEDDLARRGLDGERADLLVKPFSQEGLAAEVRRMLDAG
jgi:PAS domain S-box-containing protein